MPSDRTGRPHRPPSKIKVASATGNWPLTVINIFRLGSEPNFPLPPIVPRPQQRQPPCHPHRSQGAKRHRWSSIWAPLMKAIVPTSPVPLQSAKWTMSFHTIYETVKSPNKLAGLPSPAQVAACRPCRPRCHEKAGMKVLHAPHRSRPGMEAHENRKCLAKTSRY